MVQAGRPRCKSVKLIFHRPETTRLLFAGLMAATTVPTTSTGVVTGFPLVDPKLSSWRKRHERQAFVLVIVRVQNRHWWRWVILGCALVWGDQSPVKADEPDALAFFEKEVRPLLIERCQPCHNAEKSKNGLRLTDRESMLKGGDSGPAVVPGKPEESLLIRAVRYLEEPKMPPKKRLSDANIAKLLRWVTLGAPWPASDTKQSSRPAGISQATDLQRRWWAFQPVHDQTRPADDDITDPPRRDRPLLAGRAQNPRHAACRLRRTGAPGSVEPHST